MSVQKLKLLSLVVVLAILLSISFGSLKGQALYQPTATDPPSWTLSFDAPVREIIPMAVYDGKLYAAGHYHVQHDAQVYAYDGDTWSNTGLTPVDGASLDMVQALQVFNGRLYLGTRVHAGGSPYARVYYYDGTSLVEDFSTSGTEWCSGIEDLVVHNDILYAANGACSKGEVFQRDGDNNWVSLGGLITPEGDDARSLTSHDGSLYVGTGVGSLDPKVWRWTGSSWELVANFASLFGTSEDAVWSLASVGDLLYAGLVGPDSVSPIPVFDGTNWTLSTSVTFFSRLAAINGQLWVGTGDGKVYVNDGVTWQDYGSTGETFVYDLVEYDGAVYAATGNNGRIYKTDWPGVLTVTVDQPAITVDEGRTATNTGTVSGPGGCPITLSASVGMVTDNGNGTWSWNFATSDGPSESQTVEIYADDCQGGTSQVTFELSVNNVAPTIDSITAPTDPVNINSQPVNVTVEFNDPGTADTHDVSWNWGDHTSDTQTGATSPTFHDHTYAEVGVYAVQITITDDDGDSDTEIYEFIVIYDPEGGFVTGGGWIDSPAGAYAPDPTLTGTARFGFVSKYKKGQSVPTGQTEFQFQMADLYFHSDTYEWLVVAGPKAIIKGIGTINGAGNYGFLISAVDEDLTPSTDVDLFRIKIWDKDGNDIVVYDNQMGHDDDADPTTEIGSGNIVIHK
jgi:hypothetical protein